MNFSRVWVFIGIALVQIFLIQTLLRNSNPSYVIFDSFNSVFASDSETYVDNWKGTNRSLTVVTAFFDLGNFSKGSISNIRNVDSYRSWMGVFTYMKNPLVVYTDSSEIAEYFKNSRQSLTKVIIITREELWSFQILPEITTIYSKPNYPRYYPNTYMPEYTSMTHSKITLVIKSIESNYFKSDYYCWVDLGYFRELVGRKNKFYLEIPPDFDDSKVGVTRVYNADLHNATAKSIILGNKNWIAGGLFLGKPEVLRKFETQYKHRVKYYLSQGLMNVEQHILYSMYTAQEREKNPISVEVQLYIPGGQHVVAGDPWFYLGYVMYHEIPSNTTSKEGKNIHRHKRL